MKSFRATSFPALAARADSKHLVDTHPNQSAIPVVWWAKGAWMNHSFVQLNFSKNLWVADDWRDDWSLVLPVLLVLLVVLQLYNSIATTIMSILIVVFFWAMNMLVWLCFHRFFPQLRGCILPIRPGNPQLEWALCAETQYSMVFFLCGGYTLSRMLHVGSPPSNPVGFKGLIDTGSRCNQFFLSHQCCVQGAATWLKVKDVSGGSTSHELWHWNLTKLTPKPSLKLTASKFVPENLPFLLRQQVAGSESSHHHFSGANLYRVRVRCNFVIINFERMFHAVHAQNTYGLLG